MLFRRKKAPPAPPAKLTRLDYESAHKLAMILEKAKLGDYVQMMSKPWRSIWLNFIAGVSRGVGMVVGASLIGGLIVVLMTQGLKTTFRHVGGVPWIGEKVRDAVGFVLKVAEEEMKQDQGARP